MGSLFEWILAGTVGALIAWIGHRLVVARNYNSVLRASKRLVGELRSSLQTLDLSLLDYKRYYEDRAIEQPPDTTGEIGKLIKHCAGALDELYYSLRNARDGLLRRNLISPEDEIWWDKSLVELITAENNLRGIPECFTRNVGLFWSETKTITHTDISESPHLADKVARGLKQIEIYFTHASKALDPILAEFAKTKLLAADQNSKGIRVRRQQYGSS